FPGMTQFGSVHPPGCHEMSCQGLEALRWEQTLMESEISRQTSHEVALAVVLDREQRSKLVAYARARFGIGREDAEDLLQETALELLRQHTIVHNPRGFTFRVFHRRCCRHIFL